MLAGASPGQLWRGGARAKVTLRDMDDRLGTRLPTPAHRSKELLRRRGLLDELCNFAGMRDHDDM